MAASIPDTDLLVRKKDGLQDYLDVLEEMREFTASRDSSTPDELWSLQHHPVYTLGTSCSDSTHGETSIPIVKTDRGGQITYHGPGQLILYILADLKRRKVGIRDLVHGIEATVIDLLSDYGVNGQRRPGAPGVYVDDAKIAALGLRVRRGCCYHGLSLNVDMDLEPFENIDPCGFSGLRATQLADLGIDMPIDQVGQDLVKRFVQTFGYTL